MRPISHIVIHHSASAHKTTLEEITAWHRARGFTNVGYHYVIEGDGVVRRGRTIASIGAHTKGHNLTSVGICVVGDNTKTAEVWTPRQIESLKTLVATLCELFPNASVCGHRDLTATACPGLNVLDLL